MSKVVKIAILIIGTILIIVSCGEKISEKIAASPEEKKSKTSSSTVAVNQNSIEMKAELTPEQRLGKRLFIMCEACHNVAKGSPHKVGPNLHGIFGRKAGTEEGFIYSEAVGNADIVWSDETIRAWLKAPNDYIPGTNMVFVGLEKEHQQDALLSYLHLVTE